MPYAPHLRLSAIGTLGTAGGGVERFSYGLSLVTRSAIFDPNDAQYADLAADLVAFHGRPTSMIHPHAVLREVKVASIGADGKYTADPYIGTVLQAGGGGSGTTHAPQVACAVSLDTARRGASGRGRFYLPAPALPVDPATLTFAALYAQDIAASVVTLINDLNNEPGVDAVGMSVVVASTKGVNSPVTSVRVGRVLDTVRSRRTSLAEAYTADVGVAVNDSQ